MSKQPIVKDLKGSATVFPRDQRSLDVKSTDKTKVEKLFETNENATPTRSFLHRHPHRSAEGQKGR